MFRRHSRLVATVAAVSVSGAVLAAMSPAGATPTAPVDYDLWGAMDAATDQLDSLSQDVVAAQASLAAAERDLPAAQSELNAANSAMARAQSEEAAAAQALQAAEAAVADTKAQIEVKRAEIAKLKGALSSFARDVYTGGSNEMSELSVILGAQEINDFANGLEAIEKVSRGKNKSVDEYTAARVALDEALVELEQLEADAQARRQAASAAVSEAAAAVSRADSAKAAMESLVVARTQAVGVIEGERAVVRQQYDDLKVAQTEIETMLRAREAARVQAEEEARKAAEQAAAQAAAAAAAQAEADARAAAEQAAAQAAAQAEAAAQAAQQQAAAQAEAAAQQAAQQAAAQAAAEAAAQADAAARAAAQQVAAEQAAARAAADEAAAAEAYRTAVATEVARRNAAEAAAAAERAAAAAAAQAPSFQNQPSPAFVPEPAPAVSSGGWVYPLSGGYNSSPPGPRSHPAYGYWSCHKGEDIAAPLGSPIVAASSGTVISSGWNSGGYGNLTIIDHGGGITSLYAHQNSVAVYAGQQVSAGQVVGYVGSTGDSTGPHLHFEISVGGVAHLPSGWFGGAYGPVPC